MWRTRFSSLKPTCPISYEVFCIEDTDTHEKSGVDEETGQEKEKKEQLTSRVFLTRMTVLLLSRRSVRTPWAGEREQALLPYVRQALSAPGLPLDRGALRGHLLPVCIIDTYLYGPLNTSAIHASSYLCP